MIEIDGGMGEGGGQIIRTSLGLSALLGIPFRIKNIRMGRPRPGLRAQHVAAVRAVKAICDARVEGDEIGSKQLSFDPSISNGGEYRFHIGTAGATTLVLQTLLPPLIYAGRTSFISLSGGTHVPISPPFHFIQEVFLPVLAELGASVRSSIGAYGFYPRGGGEVEAEITPLPSGSLRAFTFPEGKSFCGVRGISGVANLPLSIAERQKEAALATLRDLPLQAKIDATSVPSPGSGTFLFLKTEGAVCCAGFSSIGVRGKRAEAVGKEAAAALLQYLDREGCIDPHLADQLVIYLALAEGQSTFTTTVITNHLLTNLAVLKRFIDFDYRIEGTLGAAGKVAIRGSGHRKAA
jgi:RNA 3'-terminal phosphate cyclase (ATP)